MANRTVINVVSGKGGTGKTLFCSVLADTLGSSNVRVLVIDLDVFVRGLTALLYFHKKESLNLTDKHQVSVADILIDHESKEVVLHELGISRYRSFDVLPSVKRIDETLNYTDIVPNNREAAILILRRLLKKIPDDYEVVILDSRAGYDELVSATHIVSDISLNIEEDDNISRITANNLFAQLQKDSSTPLFRVVNKSRHVHHLGDDQSSSTSVYDLGRIPFDGDVLNSFGEATFWSDIEKSLYKDALIRVWNALARKMNLAHELRSLRVSPLGSSKMETTLSAFSMKDRVIMVYSLLTAIMGFILFTQGDELLYVVRHQPSRVAGLVIGVAGLVMTILTLFRGMQKK